MKPLSFKRHRFPAAFSEQFFDVPEGEWFHLRSLAARALIKQTS